MPNPPRKTGSKAGRKRRRSDRPLPRKAPHRPSTYNQKLHDELAYVVTLSEGTNVELAKRCGISEVQLYTWLKKYPSFLNAYDKGKTEMKETAFVSLRKRIKGFKIKEVETKIDPNGTERKRITEKVVIPDVSAIALALSRYDKTMGPDMDKVDALLNFIHSLTETPSTLISKNKVDKDDDIDENE